MDDCFICFVFSHDFVCLVVVENDCALSESNGCHTQQRKQRLRFEDNS